MFKNFLIIHLPLLTPRKKTALKSEILIRAGPTHHNKEVVPVPVPDWERLDSVVAVGADPGPEHQGEEPAVGYAPLPYPTHHLTHNWMLTKGL
jgi:hypothetical protein